MSEDFFDDEDYRDDDDDEYEKGVFDHAIVPASILEMLRILRSVKGLDQYQFFTEIGRRTVWTRRRNIYLSALGADACIAWPAIGDTGLLKRISQRLSKPIPWICVDEPTRSWVYVEYRDGEIVEMILDPRKVWETGAMSGEVLMGKGYRDYPTLQDFLERIPVPYTPPDTQWCHARWNDDRAREHFLMAAQAFAWSIEVFYITEGPQMAFHGPVPDELIIEVARIES